MSLFLRRPGMAPGLAAVAILLALVAAPLAAILAATVPSPAWGEVLWSGLAPNLFWRPLMVSMVIGVAVSAGCVLLGGTLAWLVAMTDAPGRGVIAFLATVPFMIPSFATALAWGTLFRNGRAGGGAGLLHGLGLAPPDWLAWGLLPTIVVLIAQHFSLAFVMIAAALASVGSDLTDAAALAGASRRRILFGVVLPVVTPALLAGASLAFAGAVSNFAVPALLGLPVRMQTLSTRLFGMIEIGQTARGYVLAILLIAVSALFLGLGNRVLAGRRSFATIGGKGARGRPMALGAARWPLSGAALLVCALTTVVPVALLAAASLAPMASNLFADWTTHYWLGEPEAGVARGQAGVLRNSQLLTALRVTLGLGVAVAVAATALGLLVAVAARLRAPVLGEAAVQLAFLPMLLPGVALGAAFIALYGAPLGPLPALYGTPALLALALTASALPFAAQSGRATVEQIAGEIDEAARLTGAGFLRRLGAITAPLAARGLVAGMLLCFVSVIGDLAVVVLLYTPDAPVLSVLAYRYASDGFHQFANAVTLIILVLSVAATLLAGAVRGRRGEQAP
jgi:iron(III) transport system permease protein